MGVPHIKGYINDNRELWFDAGLDDNDTFERKLGRSGELGKLKKDPEKSVSEIEKEEKEKETRVVFVITLVFYYRKIKYLGRFLTILYNIFSKINQICILLIMY
jgi:hypothetical protein